MQRNYFTGALTLGLVAMLGCIAIPSAFVGDPGKHGFVIIEGEAAVTQQRHERGPSVRFSTIQEVTLQSVERPTQTIRGRNQSGLTWFSDIEPGTYRVKDIRLDKERGDVTYRLPQAGLAEPVLSFTIGPGELRYLGYIEIMPQNDQVLDTAGTIKLTNVLHFNIVHNRDELRAWEHVYDLYAHTPWEALLLKKIETVQKPGSSY